MAASTGYSKIASNGLVFAYDIDDTVNSYKGEPTTNIWGIVNGSSVNNKTSWDMPYAYNGSITNSVYSSGTWNGNRIWEVLHTAGTSGYAGYESWRLCVEQPTASPNTYSGTRRLAIKICVLEGSITDMALHSGGGNGAHNGANWTAIHPSLVPADCPQKTGWYQYLADAGWGSTTVGHCVGLGFISYNRVRILTTEPMYYPSDHLIPFTGYTRSTTQGLLDIAGGGSTITLNNTYNSNADFYFDGTDDVITLSSAPNLTTDMTAEVVFKPTATRSDWVRLIGTGGNGGNRTFGLWYNHPSSYLLWQRYGGVSDPSILITQALTIGSYYHYVATTSGNSHVLYLNGSQIGSATASGPWPASSENTTIGFAGFHSPMIGNIDVAKLYNRALSASEVVQNYNKYKTRFNLS